MKHDDLKRNASGYYDETAFKAIRNIAETPKPGEIWTDRTGRKTYLILQSRETVCSTLLLGKEDKDARLMVMAMVPMYTDPIMIGYTFTDMLGTYVKTLNDDSMAEVKQAVADALGITAVPSIPYAEIEALKKTKMALEDERNAAMYETSKLTEELNRANIYKDVYMDLVDKLVAARGGAADD